TRPTGHLARRPACKNVLSEVVGGCRKLGLVLSGLSPRASSSCSPLRSPRTTSWITPRDRLRPQRCTRTSPVLRPGSPSVRRLGHADLADWCACPTLAHAR